MPWLYLSDLPKLNASKNMADNDNREVKAQSVKTVRLQKWFLTVRVISYSCTCRTPFISIYKYIFTLTPVNYFTEAYNLELLCKGSR